MDDSQEIIQVLRRLQRSAATIGCPGQVVELGHRDLRLFCSRQPQRRAAEADLLCEDCDEADAGAELEADSEVGAGCEVGAGAAVASEGCWLYRPGLIFVVAGTREITVGSNRYVIKAGEYFLNCVHLPVQVRNLADPELGVFLSVSLTLDMGRFDYVRSTFTMRKNLVHKTRIRPLSRSRAETGASAGAGAAATADAAAAGVAYAAAGLGRCEYRALAPEAREAGRCIEVMSCTYDMLCVLERAVDLRRNSCPDQLPSLLSLHMLIFHVLLSHQSGFMILRRLKEENITAVDKAISFMIKNPGWDFDAAKLSEIHGLEPYIFTRHFRSEIGLPPLRWFNQVKMMLIRQLMFDKKLSLDRAMRRLGISSSDQMITAWRQLFGQPPARDVRTIRQQLQAARGQQAAVPGPYGLIYPDI